MKQVEKLYDGISHYILFLKLEKMKRKMELEKYIKYQWQGRLSAKIESVIATVLLHVEALI
uniref:Uncharacterized protein n=1 Tax=Meloidogyne incognita TaxID=6306 RepID=A0A914MIG7_MELIC